MERIERALEVARLHRHRMTEGAPATVHIAPPPAAHAPSPPSPSFAEVLAEERGRAQLEDAPVAELSPRDTLRERYVVFPDEPGAASLAYKMLRTQVLQRARQHAMRCIGVLSAASGEGKTITAINLSLSLAAETSQSVILVDLDLKHPAVAQTLGMNLEKGLDHYFADGEALENIWRRCEGIARFTVVPTLAPVTGSSELLAGTVTAGLVDQLRKVSGEPLILLDLPPVLLSDDVLSIAPLLDGVVLVVTEEQTRREDLQRVFELLRSTPVIGTVLNASAEAEARAY
jgi:Mrp family chromosome partitioning ATPase